MVTHAEMMRAFDAFKETNDQRLALEQKRAGDVLVDEKLARINATMEAQGKRLDEITLKSARGHSYKACELALQQLASKRFPLDLVTTHTFGLTEADYAIKSVGNEGAKDVIHVSLLPWK